MGLIPFLVNHDGIVSRFVGKVAEVVTGIARLVFGVRVRMVCVISFQGTVDTPKNIAILI